MIRLFEYHSVCSARSKLYYFIPQSSAQGKPSCLTHSVVRKEPFENGCSKVIYKTTLCTSKYWIKQSLCCFIQSLLSCQARMATQAGKSSSLTQRTPCILTITVHVCICVFSSCYSVLHYPWLVLVPVVQTDWETSPTGLMWTMMPC